MIALVALYGKQQTGWEIQGDPELTSQRRLQGTLSSSC